MSGFTSGASPAPDPGLERLLDTLLGEGYALYPYTPGATKNATPTPFGIVYPPAYAAASDAAFDHLQVECVARAWPGAAVTAEVRFLQPAGDRHRAEERRVTLPPAALGDLAAAPLDAGFSFPPLAGRVRLSAAAAGEGLARVTLRIENRTEVPAGSGATGEGATGEGAARELDRPAALRLSLLSTHPVLRIAGGRFVSPLERDGEEGAAAAACRNVNAWPVLATAADDAVVGAAIVLPDHPEINAASRGDLFDGTEIEEALLLHVHALSDAEREAIAGQDPWVREMFERAAATGPDDLRALHGEFQPAPSPSAPAPAEGPGPGSRAPAPGSASRSKPAAPEWNPGSEVADDNPGEERAEVGGVVFHRGGKVILRPGSERDPYDALLDGRRATVERIYLDTDDRVYLGVTVDDDPGRDLFRATGRYLFFFGHEVEAVER